MGVESTQGMRSDHYRANHVCGSTSKRAMSSVGCHAVLLILAMSVGSTIGAPVHLHPGPIPEAPVNHTSHSRVEARLERMETRIEQLEKIVHKLAPEHDECASRFPKLNPHAETVMAYSGCDADVKKETPGITNITCQNGTISFYNTNDTDRTGLFNIHIDVQNAHKDVYVFVCTLTRDQPHTAQCSLVVHTNRMKEHPDGPAWINMFFREMSSSTNCAPKQATIAGTYLWADETHSTGDYSFYAHAI